MVRNNCILMTGTIVVLFVTSIVRSQTADTLAPGMKRHAIYPTVGMAGWIYPVYGAANFNVERMFLDNRGHKFSSFWAWVHTYIVT